MRTDNWPTIEMPEVLWFLVDTPSRYKVLYGGRGGMKSWTIAKALLLLGSRKPLLVLCAREFMASIADSVHRLLANQVEEMQLGWFYEVKLTSIVGRNGSEFIFAGLRHNVDSLKSKEGIDICWVEEAANVSKSSWEKLIPTIRKDGSEIWVSFNPILAEDETYKRFVLNPPHQAIVQKVNWSDNPWFPKVLEAERLELKARDPDAYLNVWEGHTRVTLDGAIYANELRQATLEKRITRVPYDQTVPVHTFWDLGWSDSTSIWLAQAVGFEYRVIDFIQDRHRSVNDYLKSLQAKGYVYGTDYLPHDAKQQQLAAGGRSIETLLRAAGRRVQVMPQVKEHVGIAVARSLFPQIWFDEDRCSDGLMHLRHYRFEVDPETGAYGRKPLHDDNSHAAKAFEVLCQSLKRPEVPKKPQAIGVRGFQNRDLGWMGI